MTPIDSSSNRQTTAATAADFKFVVDRAEDGRAVLTLQQFKEVSKDSNGQPVKAWVNVVQQTNGGWDDAIPWRAGTYHLTFDNHPFASGPYSWFMTDPPLGRDGIRLHQGKNDDPSGPVHGCIGANVIGFMTPVHDALEKAGVLNQSIVCEVKNNFDYTISIASAAKSVNEGEDTTFTVSLSDPISKNLWVRLDIDDTGSSPAGTATYGPGKDYIIQPTTPGVGGLRNVPNDVERPGTDKFAAKYSKGWYVEIPRNTSSVTYTIHTLNDKPTTPPEGDETVKLTINDYFVEDNYNGRNETYSDYLLKQGGGHGVLLQGTLPSSPVTIIDKGNLLKTHLSGGIEGLLRTFNVTKGDVISFGFEAYSIPDKLSISGGTPTVDTGGFVSGFHSGTFIAAADTITVIVVGSSAGTAWDLDLSESAPSNSPASANVAAVSSLVFAATPGANPDDVVLLLNNSAIPGAAPAASLNLTSSQQVTVPVGSTATPASFSVQAGKDYLVRLVGFEATGQAGDLVDGYLKISATGDPTVLESHYSDINNEPALFFHSSVATTVAVTAGSDLPTAGGKATVELYDASNLHSPIVFLDGARFSGIEGEDLEIVVRRVGDVSQAGDYSLLVSGRGTAPLSAADLQNGFAPLPVHFDAGASLATVIIAPIADGQAEGVETAHVAFAANSVSAESLDNASLLGLATQADITVDDGGGFSTIVFPTVSADPVQAFEGDGKIVFKLTLSAVPNVPVSLSYTTIDGTAQAGVDYTTSAGTITFAAGQTQQTVSVTVLQDAVNEGDETLQLKILDPSGLYLANNAVVMTVDGTIHEGGGGPEVAPVVTARDVQATKGQVQLAAPSLFSVTDPNGDSITAYQFWDSTAGAASGHFTINGAVQTPGHAIDVTPAQLAQTNFVLGSVPDSLWVRANDGTLWSDWVNFAVAPYANHAPVVAVADPTYLAAGANPSASSLFTVSDFDGDAITRYQFWDSTGGAASGHWMVNGTAQGTNSAIDVTAAQLAQTTFQSGSGSDDLWVRANDGTDWGAWTEFHVVQIGGAANHAPVATAADPTYVVHGADPQASSLFTVSDIDGDTIAKYQLWDSTGNSASGHWVVNGTAQGAGVAIDVTAAQLGQTTFQSGSGSDDLWVRANDGTDWGAWKEFHVVAPVNHAPVATAADPTHVVHGADPQASSLFTVSDIDGDTIARYQLWDGTGDSASGHWVVNGTAQGAGVAIDVTAAQLGQTTFQSGSGADDLWVRANDGTDWGAWKEFHVVAPVDARPVVSGGDVSLALNQTVGAASLFSVADADDAQMAAYQFWDGTVGAGSAHFSVNGAAQGENQAIDVLGQNLALVALVGGSTAGADQLWVRANDGIQWSDWHPFTATSHS